MSSKEVYTAMVDTLGLWSRRRPYRVSRPVFRQRQTDLFGLSASSRSIAAAGTGSFDQIAIDLGGVCRRRAFGGRVDEPLRAS